MKTGCGHTVLDEMGMLCDDDATLFYVVHSKAGMERKPVVVKIAARCEKHPIRAWRSWVVDEDTYHVAEVMVS